MPLPRFVPQRLDAPAERQHRLRLCELRVDHPCRPNDAAAGKPVPAVRHRLAAARGKCVAIEDLDELARIPARGDDARHRGLLRGRAGGTRDAAGSPARVVPCVLQPAPVAAGMKKARARQAREHRVVTAEMRVDRAGVEPRGAARRTGLAVDDRHPPAARGDALGRRRAGDAAADDQDVTTDCGARRGCGGARDRRTRGRTRRQHVPLVRVTRPASDGEARREQVVAHDPGRRVRRERRVGCGEPRALPQHLDRPHPGVAIRREAVEVERVGLAAQLRQDLGDVAENKGQRDAAEFEVQPMPPGHRFRPLGAQAGRAIGQLDAAAAATLQVGATDRMLVHGDVVEPLAAPRIVPPRLPRRQEIDAQPETRLDDGERPAPRPSRRKIVASQEDLAGLGEPALGAVIDVAVLDRIGRAVAQEGDAGGSKRHRAIPAVRHPPARAPSLP